MKEKSLYEKFLDLGKDALKELNKPIARKRDRRAFESAADEAADQGYQARQSLNKLLESKIGHYGDCISELTKLYWKEQAAKEEVLNIKALYKEVFDKELKVEEE